MSFRDFIGSHPYYPAQDVYDPLAFKAINRHILVVGSSGSGKSHFVNRLFPEPDGLVLFKPDTVFKGVPLASEKGLPSPFQFRTYDVADAYLYALGIDFAGIMASSLAPLLMQCLGDAKEKLEADLSDSGRFQLFFDYVRAAKKDKLTSSVASVLAAHFSVLYPKSGKKGPGRPRGDDAMERLVYRDFDGKISFANLGSFKAEFGAELFLRDMYSKIGSEIGTVVIDEFHHVARSGSIVDILLREFRISGRLVAVSQSLSDVAPSMISNFGYVFLGRSTHPRDLDYLEKLDPKLPRIISNLPARVFMSLPEYLETRHLSLYGWVDE